MCERRISERAEPAAESCPSETEYSAKSLEHFVDRPSSQEEKNKLAVLTRFYREKKSEMYRSIKKSKARINADYKKFLKVLR